MDDVFSIGNLEHSEGIITAALAINADSLIFKGHFPGQPVVPGACMLNAVRAVLEQALGRPIKLNKATQLKFVGILVPIKAAAALLEITYKTAEIGIIANGKLTGDRVCMKFQASYSTIA